MSADLEFALKTQILRYLFRGYVSCKLGSKANSLKSSITVFQHWKVKCPQEQRRKEGGKRERRKKKREGGREFTYVYTHMHACGSQRATLVVASQVISTLSLCFLR